MSLHSSRNNRIPAGVILPVLLFSAFVICAGFNSIQPRAARQVYITILDENGIPTAARVRITGNDSEYYAPEGHRIDFPVTERGGDTGQGGDVMLDHNRRFAYVEGTFKIFLPEQQSIRVEAVKGFTYYFIDSLIHITSETDSIVLRLKKWFSFPGKNEWYSGDVHTHEIDSATALLEMKAEDLNVCNILISDFTTDQASFRGAPEPISDSLHIVYLNQEYREDRLGHVNLLNLRKLIAPVKSIRPYQYPLNMQAMDKARAQGGHVSWAHFAAFPGLEGPLAIVMKKVDAVELLCTIDPFSDPIFAADVVPDLGMNSGLQLWYRLLNCGLKIPATAGTDKMNNWVTVGANRVYAQVKGRFNYQSWIDALNNGKSFITNSPMIFCTVNNHSAGDVMRIAGKTTVTISAEVFTRMPIDRLQIVANGEVIGEKIIEKGDPHAKLEITFTPVRSAWIAARAYQVRQTDTVQHVSFAKRRDVGGGTTWLNRYYGTLRPETAFAHTSPCYVMVDNKPIRSAGDAAYFVRYLQQAVTWLQQSGRFPDPQARQDVLKAFKKGISMYRSLQK